MLKSSAPAHLLGKGFLHPVECSGGLSQSPGGNGGPAFCPGAGKTTLSAPDFPVYANTSGDRYPQAVSELRSLLAQQLASPVDFVKEVESMYRDGVRIFIEVGPGARLSGMVRTILKGKTFKRSPLILPMANVVPWSIWRACWPNLATLGVNVALTSWDEGVLEQAAQQPVKKKD
jgi:acyl transferase domain-containing protein